jgi:probable F420-dependent oxidoreductase
MKYGLGLKQPGIDVAEYPSIAQAAEQRGFESVWLPEHLLLPAELPATYPYSDSGHAPISPETPELDPWVALAAVAAATSTVRLGTGVYILPLRHPVATARSVMTLDRVSRGRVTMGIGVGWMAEEFAMLGQSFDDRGARTDECIEVIRLLFSDRVVEHHGAHFDLGPARFEPKPVQGAVPIEVGGTSPPALRRAGRLGDGWIELGSANLDQVVERLAVIQAARQAAGRAGRPFEVTCGLAAEAAADRATVARYQAAGVTRLMVGPPRGDSRLAVEDVIEWINRFADTVIDPD